MHPFIPISYLVMLKWESRKPSLRILYASALSNQKFTNVSKTFQEDVWIYWYKMEWSLYEHMSISVYGVEYAYSERGIERIIEDCHCSERNPREENNWFSGMLKSTVGVAVGLPVYAANKSGLGPRTVPESDRRKYLLG